MCQRDTILPGPLEDEISFVTDESAGRFQSGNFFIEELYILRHFCDDVGVDRFFDVLVTYECVY